ncbi:MAG: ABC transporter ATP-binding protein [Eubacteriales bacterium]|nr:ABC transporter ATP-binding protein [Eubacteriales bacterium]
MEPLLQVEHVTVCYNGNPVVQDVSFTLEKGEILGVVGESGSGKSTIIKAIIGLLGEGGMVTRGDIYYQGRNVVDMPQKEKRRLLGPEIGMVFQDCKAALCPIRTVGAQIYESLSEHEKVTKEETYERAGILMKKTGMDDYQRVLNSYSFELSGGMNQRVGICAAMMMKPSLLLADEPTSALDVTVQKQVVEEMKLMRREYGTAMILVTHNIGVVNAMADHVLVLKQGRMMDYGPADRVLSHSENAYTKKLMDSVLHLRRNRNVGGHFRSRTFEEGVSNT